MSLRKSLLMVLWLTGCGIDANSTASTPDQVADSEQDDLRTPPGGGKYCNSGCVVDTFRTLAPLYRPSGDEKELRAKVIELIGAINERRWDGRLQIVGRFLDAPDAGLTKENFLVRVPPTGSFRHRHLPAVALQAHMDMVLASTEVPAGGDLKAWFRAHPVNLADAGDFIQSVDQKTTIGADDTIGTAMQLRYALDPTIEHPALELIFTTHEEVGLKGAAEWDTQKLAIHAPVMVSLDGDNSDKLIYGSQGSARRSLTSTTPMAAAASDARLVKVTMSKLLGGHSGLDIHRQRLNAVVALTSLANEALNAGILGVESAVSGELGGINKIPSSLVLSVAVPATFDVPAFKTRLVTAAQALVAQAPGEAMNTAVLIDVVEVTPTGPLAVLDGADASRLITTVLAMNTTVPPLNGVISTSDIYPNGVNTSSNLGYLELKRGPTSNSLSLAFMERSFSSTEQAATTQRIIDHLKGAFKDPSVVTVTTISGYDPWLEDKSSWLVKLAAGSKLPTPRFSVVSVQPVGLEPSYFKLKYPNLKIVGFSPTIIDYHTPRERVSVSSVHDITKKLDAFLVELGKSKQFAALGQQ